MISHLHEHAGFENSSSAGQFRDAPAQTPIADDVQQRVRLFLQASNLPGLRRLDIEVQGDTVILRGRVRTYYEKQLAVRLSRRVAGVIRVVDLLEVQLYVPRVDPGQSNSWRWESESRQNS